MSAAVNFMYVRTDDVAKMTTLAAKLGARLEMSRDQESKSQDISVAWQHTPSNQTVAALILMLSAQDRQSPKAIIEHIKSTIDSFGFDPDAQVD